MCRNTHTRHYRNIMHLHWRPLSLYLFIVSCLYSSLVTAQTDSLNMPQLPVCGLNEHVIVQSRCGPDGHPISYDLPFFEPGEMTLSSSGGGSGGMTMMALASSASPFVNCGGKIDLYFMDIMLHTGAGFDDPSRGATRIATLCKVMNDIQHTFDFSLVSNTDHIRILVDQSVAPGTSISADCGTKFLAQASYFFAGSLPPGIIGGYFNDYVTTGIDPVPSTGYHGHIQFNYDATYSTGCVENPITWNDDYHLTPNCTIDEYTAALHEMGHVLGFISFVRANDRTPGTDSTTIFCDSCNGISYVMPTYTHIYSLSAIPAHVFTRLDTVLMGSPTNRPTGLVPLITYSGTTPMINPAAILPNNNYWANRKDAPDNYPIFSGDVINMSSFFSHFDDRLFSYTYRERISPGERSSFVMGPTGAPGVYRRNYSKGEIQTFVSALGYVLDTTVAGAATALRNHLPYSKKSGNLNITYGNYRNFTEISPVDYEMTNDIGSTLNINLSDTTFTNNDLGDADAGDVVVMDTASIVNIRGCGSGGNNHNLLTAITPTHITYTPRHNFYGRAQLAFNITDGKEKGSYRVVTINVKRGTNVGSDPAHPNLVCNADFEEGSEQVITGKERVNYFTIGSYFSNEGKWQGISFSDAHPYSFNSHAFYFMRYMPYCGTIVRNSNINCAGTFLHSFEGTLYLKLPRTNTAEAYLRPNPPSGGDRYQLFEGYGESYYLLTDSVSKCYKYTLSYDVAPTDIGAADQVCLLAKFADSIGHFNCVAVTDTYTVPGNTWQHKTFSFYYCSDRKSNMLFLKKLSGASVVIDNISLTQQVVPDPLTVQIVDSTTNCNTKLIAKILNPGCPNNLYSWSTPGSGGIVCNTCSSTFVTPAGPQKFIVNVSDTCGLRHGADSITIDNTVLPITGPSQVCIGSNYTYTDATAGGTWSSSNTSRATIGSATGVMTALSSGTCTITYKSARGCIMTLGVTVNAIPAISGTLTVCAGQSSTLTPSTGGGTWASSNTAIATASATGVVSTVAAGTVNITYTTAMGGCVGLTTMTVNAYPAAISVPGSLCPGGSMTLGDATSGGTWSSSNIPVVTIGAATGLANGLVTGTSTISYTVSGCPATTVVSVNTAPAISGPSGLCLGGSATLGMTSGSGGTWSSSNTAVATISSTGVVSAIATGTTIISYAAGSICPSAMTLTVNANPATISGMSNVCNGGTITLTDATTGGTWSSANTAIATIGSGSGILTATGIGTTTISYMLPTGCFTTAIATVNAQPGNITFSGVACVGSTITLGNSVSGGVWSSSNTARATIGSTTGILTAIATGTTVISYSTASGCSMATTLTVQPTPVISGTSLLCVGNTVSLSSTVTGGTWAATSGVSVSATGIVTGISPGSSTVSYTTAAGCPATYSLSVNPQPAPITVPGTVCPGNTITLSDAVAGGSWSMGTSSVAALGTGGIVAAISSGTATVTYSMPGGCFVTAIVTVSPTPVISGISSLCSGTSTTLTATITGGIWGSLSTAIATVNTTGVVSAVSAGTAIITYTSPAGCTASRTITVNVQPATFTVPDFTCTSGSMTLSDVTAGGTWTSATPAVATIGAATGIVTSIALGTSVITYTMPGGCYTTGTVTVNAAATIYGASDLCVGSATLFGASIGGGTWLSSNTAIAAVSATGSVTAVSAGTVTISYLTSPYCPATINITVHNYPAPISGPSGICMGSTAILVETATGGAWYSDNPAVATVAFTGLVSGLSVGVAGITYMGVGGCPTATTVTVNASPSPIYGDNSLCQGSVGFEYDDTYGGTWSVSAMATIDVTGTILVSSTATGIATVSYTLPDGCYSTYDVLIRPTPPAITGAAVFCAGHTITLADALPDGTWSSGSTAIATVGSTTGIVSGVSGGAVYITYTSPFGCVAATAVSVDPLPAPISGPSSLCLATGATLTDAVPGGTWSSSNPAIVYAFPDGTVFATAAGTAVITYTIANSCGTVYATKTITVYSLPAITGSAALCNGTTITLSDGLSGGSWTSSNTTIATVGSASGIVAGIGAGTATITYRMPGSSCFVTKAITVNPKPTPINGLLPLCAGATSVVTDATPYGSWSSSNTAVATINAASGVVNALSAGTTTISYILPTGCYATGTLTVNGAILTGDNSICHGNTISLSATAPGGTWTSNNTSVATVSATGVVTGVSAGSAVITYGSAATAGCMTPFTVFVYDNSAESAGKPCTPCAVYGDQSFTTIASPTITANLSAGRYYISQDETVVGNITFTGTVIDIANDKNIFVDPFSSLTIVGGHLFDCDRTWKGITLSSNTPLNRSGRIVLSGSGSGVSTLIEDAQTAITAVNLKQPSVGGNNFITCNDAIFNRNNNDILIGSYAPATSSVAGTPAEYGFNIQNTVFTSRAFNKYKNTAGVSYPLAWPVNLGANGLKSIIATTSPYQQPYYVQNYSRATVHGSAFPAQTAILLKDVGMASGGTYMSVRIGNPATNNPNIKGSVNREFNIFDTHVYGIQGVNSNVIAVNNYFVDLYSVVDKTPLPYATEGNVGIYTQMDNGNRYQMLVQPGVYVNPSYINSSPNYFYGCLFAVMSFDYYHIKGTGSNMRTAQTPGVDFNSRFGYLVRSSAYDSINISGNSIYNTANGISVTTTLGTRVVNGMKYTFQTAGTLNVNNNAIKASIVGTPTYEYTSYAISLQNVVSNTGGTSFPGLYIWDVGEVHTDYNTIRDAYRGIYVGSYWAQQPFSQSNTITVRADPSKSISFGINHSDCAQNIIRYNNIAGADFSSGKTCMSDSVRGVYSAYDVNAELQCNYTTNLGRGFEFYLKNPGTAWHDNKMTNHGRGLVLNKASIGDQGSMATSSIPGVTYNNIWAVPSAWNMFDHLQTWVQGDVSAIYSRLFVKNTTAYLPTNNNAAFYGDRYIFDPSGTQSLVSTISPGVTPCPTLPSMIVGSGRFRFRLHEQIVQKHVNYTTDSASNDWLGQYTIWQSLKQDTTQIDSSEVLESFNNLALNSRFAVLTNIESSLAQGDSETAITAIYTPDVPLVGSGDYSDSTTGVVVADDTSGDYLMSTYKNFYALYLRYASGSLNADDSATVVSIANYCPSQYGAVVYRARSLYVALYNDLPVWNDDSCGNADSTRIIIASRQSPGNTTSVSNMTTTQVYNLFPNPNDGNLTLQNAEGHDLDALVEVMNVTGASVYKQQLSFRGGVTTVKLGDVSPGLYILKLTDDKNRIFTFKFIVR